eukprot:CAMPEP_0168620764 /NCGR_PEP_ID=MMETSP0449_2-20121227/7324_1 /TAXON_ID=1082188 /ORGANISM="Strombidium rassoulzadegani, Strain ras09" /LENGTH=81 /DNA_ID=CAMNT_0008661817 /DNA_START=111 /DNA_END=356 /DNA_ORIENTATION=+
MTQFSSDHGFGLRNAYRAKRKVRSSQPLNFDSFSPLDCQRILSGDLRAVRYKKEGEVRTKEPHPDEDLDSASLSSSDEEGP